MNNKKEQLDLLIVNRDADIIKVYSERIMEAFDSVQPKIRVKRISDPYLDMAKDKYLRSDKLLFLVESIKGGLKANLIQKWIKEIPGINSDPRKYLVIFRCPNNKDIRNEYLTELSEAGFSREQFVFIDEFDIISSWWPQVIKFSLKLKQPRSTDMSLTLFQSNEDDERSNMVRSEITKMLKAFDVKTERNPYTTAGHVLILHKEFSATEHLSNIMHSRYFESKTTENVHAFYASNLPVPEEIKPHTDSVHKRNELMKGLLYILVDMKLVQARRHRTVFVYKEPCCHIRDIRKYLGKIMLMVLMILLSLPILFLNCCLLVCISVPFILSLGLMLLPFSKEDIKVFILCACLVLCIVSFFALIFMSFLFYSSDSESKDLRRQIGTLHAILLVWSVVIFVSMFNEKFTIFHIPHKLWPKVNKHFLTCMADRTREGCSFGHPCIRVPFLIMAVILNIPILLCMLVICCLIPVYILCGLCCDNYYDKFKKLKYISTDIHTAMIFSAFYTVPAVLIFYQSAIFTQVIIACALITADMFVWMYMVGTMVKKKYDCEFGVLSIPFEIFERFEICQSRISPV